MSKGAPNIEDPRYVKAMSHPYRVRILAMLSERDASPAELARWLGTTLGNAAHHVRTLHRLGVIELVRTRQVRGAVQHFYRTVARPRVSDEAWAAASSIAKQAAVGSSLQLIDEYAQASAEAGGFAREEAKLVRGSLRLDRQGWEQAARAYAGLLERLEEIAAGAESRAGSDPHDDGGADAALVLMLFGGVRAPD
jgi:DNA-binding transcriptional ArsR family regulator